LSAFHETTLNLDLAALMNIWRKTVLLLNRKQTGEARKKINAFQRYSATCQKLVSGWRGKTGGYQRFWDLSSGNRTQQKSISTLKLNAKFYV